MSLRDIFKPKPDKFLQLLVEQTRLTVRGLDLLKSYLEKRDKDTAKKLNATEKEADEVRRIMVEELMRTFITPIDREDIFALSREIDDVLDYANTTVEEMEVLEVDPTPFMVQMTTLLHDATMELLLATERMQDNHFKVASDHSQKAKSLENRVEVVYREAIADLFRKPKDVKDVMVMLKVREIYRHLSNSADRIDGAANVIADIVMKMG
jgi:predicted phosphate transport protein (TIGR00153 family)